jgi:endonuclease/exonuclease/phosphatase family metal-dependent hydrolase
MRRKSLIVVLVLLAVSLLTSFSAGQTKLCRKVNPSATVMTRNLDAGSDFGYVLAAVNDPNSTELDLLMAITNTYSEMIASNIPGRADGIATEILLHRPDLIGLQEVTTLRTGPYGEPASTVVVDGLQSLLDALAKKGLHYSAVAVQTNAVVDLPAFDASGSLITVGFTDYDAILARTDLPTSQFKVSNVAMEHFSVYLPFTVAGQTIPFLRGWISLEVNQRGRQYKFVTSHLETFSPDVQAAQANELVMGPLVSTLPIVLASDLNSDAYQPSWDNGPAIQILEAAGLVEVWSKLYPRSPGLTWPLFAEDPTGSSTLRQRIDLILTNGSGLKNRSIQRTGMFAWKGVYSSDHTGVLGQFELLP